MKEVTEQDADIISYLGKKRYKEVKKIKPEVAKIFTECHVKPEGALLVEGSKSSLLKFKNYFLVLCAGERPAYCQYMLSEYVEGLASKSIDDDIVNNMEKELMFLYCHKEPLGIGNTENWIEAKTLSQVANRNRKGLITVVLSERELPLLQKSEELKYVDLVKPFKQIKVRTYLDSPAATDKASTDEYVPTY